VNTPNTTIVFTNNTTGDLEINADRKQLIRAISNLIKNAIQAIPKDRLGKIEVTLAQKENSSHITVSDNGSGISQEGRDKIFEPYFTTKSGGTGLGLAMVRNILNEFGGQISFESNLNEGTTFFIVFKG
jgi:signal transduction histidine kinase